MSDQHGPMTGIRILDIGTMLAAPMAASLLADQGAEVIKIEPPGIGDVMRYIGANRNGIGGIWQGANRGKRSLALNLQSDEGLELLQLLVKETDVLMHNFRPGVAERLGVDYGSLAAINPDLIYLSVSGFGDTGPYAKKSAYDNVIQAFSGVAMSQANTESGEPCQYYQIFSDKLTALTASQAITAALFARERGQGGQQIKLAMVDAVASFMWPDVAGVHAFLDDGAQEGLQVAKGVPLIAFKDGYAQAAPVSDEQFAGWCKALKVDGSDPAVATLGARQQNTDAVLALSQQAFANAAEMTVDEGIARFEAEDVPCARAMHLHELPDHPQMQHNGTFVVTEHPIAGRICEPRPAAMFTQTPPRVAAPSAALGQHSEDILLEMGVPRERLDKLKDDGVIG